MGRILGYPGLMTRLVAVFGLAVAAGVTPAFSAPWTPPVSRSILPNHPGEQVGLEDPIAFFERLVRRYRSLRRYAERVEVLQITKDPGTGDPAIRTLTRFRAEITGDDLRVDRSELTSRAIDALTPHAVGSGASDEELWMLPHLSLRFADQPLEQFRPGGRDPFRPSEVDRVTIRNRELVRVELLSGDEEDPAARFNLFIDPERMLVERVEGDEWLPGGLHHQTTVRIENHVIGVEVAPSRDPTPNRTRWGSNRRIGRSRFTGPRPRKRWIELPVETGSGGTVTYRGPIGRHQMASDGASSEDRSFRCGAAMAGRKIFSTVPIPLEVITA